MFVEIKKFCSQAFSNKYGSGKDEKAALDQQLRPMALSPTPPGSSLLIAHGRLPSNNILRG